jgi:carboxylesterase
MYIMLQKKYSYFLGVLLISPVHYQLQPLRSQHFANGFTHNYAIAAQDIVREAKIREDSLPVRSGACRSVFFLQPQPTKKVFVFFHGFTACPYQFIPMEKALAQAGYNVLIPLMPGHGQAGDWNRNQPPPLPTNPQLYQQFSLLWLQKAQGLGEEVIVGGLSGGSTLAAWLALERPQQIDRALFFAPYLSSGSLVIDLFVRRSKSYFK